MLEHTAVVGAGTMGSGIAQVFAASGLNVTLIDLSSELIDRGLRAVEQATARGVASGRLSEAERAALLARVSKSVSLESVASAQLVIEAVVEDVETKMRVFSTIDKVAPEWSILASNTSSVSITRLGAATNRPDRVIGMHFMNPAPVMRLVEVVRGLGTSDATQATIIDLARDIGKTPIAVNDSPGFALNRMLVPMINEAIYLLMEGAASAEDIDTVMQLGARHPMGPLALADLVGLDTCLAIMEVLQRDLGDDKYRPCPLLRKMVSAGRLGKKSRQGFYAYGR